MRTDAKIATAVAGGYLLGRRHKAKLAVGLGLWLTGRRISLDPAHLAGQLAGLPLVRAVRDQIGGELGAVCRKALSGAVTSRADAWAESLGRRTALLRGDHSGSGSRAKDEDDDGTEEADERQEREAADDAEQEPAAPARRGARSGAAAARSAGSRAARSARGRTSRATKERA